LKIKEAFAVGISCKCTNKMQSVKLEMLLQNENGYKPTIIVVIETSQSPVANSKTNSRL